MTDSFTLRNNVRLSRSHALLLLYRYLTGIYALGDLSFVQFLSGYLRGEKRTLDEPRILAVSGNGMGELEKMLCLQWTNSRLDTMAVSPFHMQIMRLFLDASAEEVSDLFAWAQESVGEYPNLQTLFDSPGLVNYWRQQIEIWKSSDLKGRLRLFSGSPLDLEMEQTYDAIVLSHAQKLLGQNSAQQILPLLKPGGVLAALMPVVFGPVGLKQPMSARFSDLPAVQYAKQNYREGARDLGYGMSEEQPLHVDWPITNETTVQVVTFSIASPLRSLLIGELLIQSLDADLQDDARFSLLESALSDIAPTTQAGTESLLILIYQKEGS